ncbi:FKBP-type peptidyl-prolyl cis-trans isomerase [Gaopeijia maritima]|uniref:Peptidyl-prolyl cis-trans isomerase n=1 Tax=Gaopeijia maritima TaxID=3119007 RepID=A0ABU9E704_9BACT
MAQAKTGDTVHIHYTGRLGDGTVFDSSRDRDPLSFTLGQGQVIPGFEAAVAGMETGESKTTEIPSGEAYGPRRPEMEMSVPRTQLPEGMNPEVGQQLQMQTPDGQAVPVRVTGTSDEAIDLDANHPLAGQDLIFDIELVKVG